MAIEVINSQGTQVWIADVPATAWADCDEAITGLQAGSLVGCPQSLGDIGGTRSVTEYKCLSSDESAKSLGSISRGNIEIGLLLDPADVEGQAALNAAWESNTNVMVGIELSDADVTLGETGASGTIFYFEGGVSSVMVGITMDEAVTYTVVVEISSEITECPMVPGTA